MAIPKRINTTRRVVSRFDPAWTRVIHRRCYGEYCNTLDIAKIGDISEFDFTTFDVRPLQVAYEVFADDNGAANAWEIFRSHVVNMSGFDFERDGDRIRDKHHEEIGPKIIKDIADMIVQLANADGQTLFFAPPDGYMDFLQSCQRRLASEAVTVARSADATNK